MALGPKGAKAAAFDSDQAADASMQMQRQRLTQMFQGKLSDAHPGAAERAAREFIEHLRESSPIAFEKLATNQMDDEELNSRAEVYLRDHPELSGQSIIASTETPRTRVADLLKGEPGIGSSDAERLANADRFIDRLKELSGAAHESLLSGRMTTEELQSRVKVFAADVRAEATVATVDPAAAAAVPIVDSFVKANFGRSTERADSVCYKGVITENGTKREFVIFKKRPRKIRIHIIENGLVIGVLGFDGTTAWRQAKGQPAIPVVGSDADAVVNSARFDDPLVDYRERGADVRLEGKAGSGPFLLHIRERDGVEMVAAVDPVKFSEVSLRTRRENGRWDEMKFSDYRKVGTLSFACVQEDWRDGALRSTTRITDVRLDPGLLDRFFAFPQESSLGFMEYMSALAIVEARATKAGSAPRQAP